MSDYNRALSILTQQPKDFHDKSHLAEHTSTAFGLGPTMNELREDAAAAARKRQKNAEGQQPAPEGSVAPEDHAPGDDVPADWEAFYGAEAPMKRKADRVQMAEALEESCSELLMENDAGEKFIPLSEAVEVLAELIDAAIVVQEAYEELYEDYEPLHLEYQKALCHKAVDDFMRGASEFARSKVKAAIDDMGLWEMATDPDYLKKMVGHMAESKLRPAKSNILTETFVAPEEKSVHGDPSVLASVQASKVLR